MAHKTRHGVTIAVETWNRLVILARQETRSASNMIERLVDAEWRRSGRERAAQPPARPPRDGEQ